MAVFTVLSITGFSIQVTAAEAQNTAEPERYEENGQCYVRADKLDVAAFWDPVSGENVISDSWDGSRASCKYIESYSLVPFQEVTTHKRYYASGKARLTGSSTLQKVSSTISVDGEFKEGKLNGLGSVVIDTGNPLGSDKKHVSINGYWANGKLNGEAVIAESTSKHVGGRFNDNRAVGKLVVQDGSENYEMDCPGLDVVQLLNTGKPNVSCQSQSLSQDDFDGLMIFAFGLAVAGHTLDAVGDMFASAAATSRSSDDPYGASADYGSGGFRVEFQEYMSDPYQYDVYRENNKVGYVTVILDNSNDCTTINVAHNLIGNTYLYCPISGFNVGTFHFPFGQGSSKEFSSLNVAMNEAVLHYVNREF